MPTYIWSTYPACPELSATTLCTSGLQWAGNACGVPLPAPPLAPLPP